METFEISNSFKSKIFDLCKGHDIDKIQDLLDYNINTGKLTRYSLFCHVSTNCSNFDKNLVGFLIEAFHSSFLISDDIIDNSTMRRGKKCFYFLRGMKTLRDSRFLIALVYKIIKKFNLQFREVIEKGYFYTCMGQTIDTKDKTRQEFTFELYKRISELKTAYYTVYMPLYCGYVMSKRRCPEYFEDLAYLIGLVYQMNDDYVNFFPEKTKKSSNDLEEFKLTYFTAKLNEEKDLPSEVDLFYTKKSVPDFIKKWIFANFEKYFKHKEELIEKTRDMILKEDEGDLLFLFNVLKKYELN